MTEGKSPARIGVIATEATIASNAYFDAIRRSIETERAVPFLEDD